MRDHLGNIQVLRGIACLLVVLYHTSTDESRFGMPFQPLHSVQWFGYAGVDLFFVISGFIIASSNRVNLGRPGQLPKYLFRRLWRIYPTYWAALAIITGLWAVIAPHLFESITAWEIVETVALLPQQPMPRLIPAAWSLSYELMFYLVFASLFLLPRRFAGAVLLIWGVVVLSVPLIGYKPANRFVALSLNPYVLEFLAGAAAAYAAQRPERTRCHHRGRRLVPASLSRPRPGRPAWRSQRPVSPCAGLWAGIPARGAGCIRVGARRRPPRTSPARSARRRLLLRLPGALHRPAGLVLSHDRGKVAALAGVAFRLARYNAGRRNRFGTGHAPSNRTASPQTCP
jgi:hypothetical protein